MRDLLDGTILPEVPDMANVVSDICQWLRDVASAEPSAARAPFYQEAADDIEQRWGRRSAVADKNAAWTTYVEAQQAEADHARTALPILARAVIEAADRLRVVREGIRNYEGRGMSTNGPADYEVPPSASQKLRRDLATILRTLGVEP